jgi:hypothetical protein
MYNITNHLHDIPIHCFFLLIGTCHFVFIAILIARMFFLTAHLVAFIETQSLYSTVSQSFAEQVYSGMCPVVNVEPKLT